MIPELEAAIGVPNIQVTMVKVSESVKIVGVVSINLADPDIFVAMSPNTVDIETAGIVSINAINLKVECVVLTVELASKCQNLEQAMAIQGMHQVVSNIWLDTEIVKIFSTSAKNKKEVGVLSINAIR